MRPPREDEDTEEKEATMISAVPSALGVPPTSRRRRNTSGIITACLAAPWLFLIGLAPAAAQSVTVVQTNYDQSKLLETQPPAHFAAGAELPLAIRVDDGIRYQEMDGFGASFTDSSAWLVGTKLTADQRRTLMRDLFGEHGIRLSFLRQPMGATDLALGNYTYDDMPPGQSDPDLGHFSIDHDRPYILPVLRQALSFNPQARVMALPWSPPAWMKTNDALGGGGFDSRNLHVLAGYFVKSIRAYEQEGVPVHFVAAQNEPLYAGQGYPDEEHHSYPTTFFSEAQMAEFIGRHLGPALEREGLDTRIMGFEHNWDNTLYPLALLSDRQASRYLAGVSFHCYAGNRDSAQGAVHALFPEVGIWFTECTGVTRFPVFGDNLGWNMHNLVIGATRQWARSVALWNMALDQTSGPVNGPADSGCKDCRGVVTIDWSTTPATVRYEVEYYALGHASKFVMPGAHRINSNFAGPVENVAFRNPDGSIALLAYNSDGRNPRTFSVSWRGQAFSYTLPPGAVATFKWDTIEGRDFDLALSPDSRTVAAGEQARFTIDLTRYNGDHGDVHLSVSGLPPGASADINEPDGRGSDGHEGDGHEADGHERHDGDHDFGDRAVRVALADSTPPGTYVLTVTGRSGRQVHTAKATLIVGPAPTPYGGTAWTLPGRIQAEDYDLGGEGIAYHDTSAGNNGGQYRSDDVDIETASDVGGGYDVGWTDPGEWLRYTVNVESDGVYQLDARVAALGGGRNFHVEIGGKDVTGSISVPDTGGWQNWRTVSSPAFRLHAGPQVLRIVFDSAGGNLNWFAVRPAFGSTPFSGAPIALPGLIQAENFDAGGPGLAYNDLDPGNNGHAYRNDSVHIEATTDDGGGYDVGWTGEGEWLNYSVSVAATGRYTVLARVASMAPGGSFHLSLDGVPITKSVTVPGTDGWQNWQTIEIPDVPFSAGQHVLQLVMDGAGYWGTPGNFNWISVE
jgi:glucosylceramidase